MNPLFSDKTLEMLAAKGQEFAWILFDRWRAAQHPPDQSAERRRQYEVEQAWRREALDIETENRAYMAEYQQRRRARKAV